jgi:exosortase/archaeosortase family protein
LLKKKYVKKKLKNNNIKSSLKKKFDKNHFESNYSQSSFKNKFIKYFLKNKFFDKKLLIFLSKFFMIFFVLEIILLNLKIDFYNSFLAFVTSAYLGFLNEGNKIFLYGAVFVVDNSCTGFVSIIMLASLIFSIKGNLFKKTKFFIFGALVLLLINIFRIMLVLLGANIGFNSNLIHTLTWFIMSGIVLGLWYYFITKILLIKNIKEII